MSQGIHFYIVMVHLFYIAMLHLVVIDHIEIYIAPIVYDNHIIDKDTYGIRRMYM